MIGNNKSIQQALVVEIQGNRELKCVQRPQPAPVSVASDEALCGNEMVHCEAANLKAPCGDVEDKSGALDSGCSLIQMAGANLHSQGCLDFEKTEARYSNDPLGLVKNRSDRRGSDFRMVVLDDSTSVE